MKGDGRMKAIKIKRVCLFNADTEQYSYMEQDFLPTLDDFAILNYIFEYGKHVWKGHTMYKVVVRSDGTTRFDGYEVFTVTQYVPSWYDNLRRKVRGW